MTKQNEKPREGDCPISASFTYGMLRVQLQDGREIATPLDWYPTLMEANEAQLINMEFSLSGIYWPDLDEDLSIAGMLRGIRPPQRNRAADNM